MTSPIRAHPKASLVERASAQNGCGHEEYGCARDRNGHAGVQCDYARVQNKRGHNESGPHDPAPK
eukprot:scaffold161988_cov34-Tisochrysis_lutea.AAC.1